MTKIHSGKKELCYPINQNKTIKYRLSTFPLAVPPATPIKNGVLPSTIDVSFPLHNLFAAILKAVILNLTKITKRKSHPTLKVSYKYSGMTVDNSRYK